MSLIQTKSESHIVALCLLMECVDYNEHVELCRHHLVEAWKVETGGKCIHFSTV